MMQSGADKDGDGKVTKQDFQMSGGKSPAGADLDVDDDGDMDQDDFNKLDVDGDGDVDEDDYEKMMQSGADKDGDGKVTKQDFQMSGGQSPATADLDVDDDGDMDEDDFNMLDVDGDGDIDQDDFELMAQECNMSGSSGAMDVNGAGAPCPALKINPWDGGFVSLELQLVKLEYMMFVLEEQQFPECKDKIDWFSCGRAGDKCEWLAAGAFGAGAAPAMTNVSA